MTDFATKFHNLEGDLIRDRKKSFFKLLKETALNSTQSDINQAIENLRPKSYQEKLFWVETLVYFKKTAPLIELLKEGNREYVKIIVRQKWFIEDAFKDMSALELVNQFFPCVSYSTRLKLLRRIPNCWSEEKVDELFDAVQKRYGIYIALDVLHVCSTSKIKRILEENEILLHAHQVIHIFKKNEDLFKIYIDYSVNLFKKPYDEKGVLNLLAYKNPSLFLQLLKSNKIVIKKLPKTATAGIVNMAKQEILEDPQHYYKILNARALVSMLKTDFVTFYRTFFPKKFQEITSTCYSIKILKHLPKNTRWRAFYETFKINFPQKSISELFMAIDSTILKLNPGKEIVKTWAEVKYKATNDENFLQYYQTAISIPMLKEKINVTSDKVKRQAMLMLLITTCAENKDVQSLEEVMQYVESRHKNEDAYTYRKIMEFICNTFNNGELSKKHWDFIRQQVILIRTKGTINFYDYRSIVDQLLVYGYKNDKQLFYVVAKEYIKDAADSSLYFGDSLQNSDLDREIFLEFCKLLPELLLEDHKYFKSTISSTIEEFNKIGQLRPEDPLNLLQFPYLVSAIEGTVNKNVFDYHEERIIKFAILYHLNVPKYSLPFLNATKICEVLSSVTKDQNGVYGDVVRSIVKKERFSETERVILIHFLERQDLDKVGDWMMGYIIDDLLLQHPAYLAKYFDRIYSRDLACFDKKWIRHYSHLGLNKKIYECLSKDWMQQDHQLQLNIMNIIQNLLSEEEYIDFVDQHFSPDKHLDDSHDNIVILQMQQYIAGLLKKANTAIKYLPLLLKFCKEDLLNYTLPSLYSLFSRSPENKLHPFIKILSERDIFIRKHAVFLSCEFLDYNYVFNLLKSSDCSPHPSRKYLCMAALKYFAKNCSEQLFILTTKFLDMINKSHKEIFSTLVRIRIPKTYRARYIEICWKLFENVDDDKINVNKHFDRLLEQSFDEDVLKSISPLFVKNVINRHLFIQGEHRLINIDKFAVLCLEYRSIERPNNFAMVFGTLSKSNKRIISGFCTVFVNFVYSNPDSKFINTYIENWNKYFSTVDALDEYITFNLLLKYSSHPLEEYATAAVDYLEQLIYEFGPPVFDVFKVGFENLMGKMKKIDQYNLFYSMINYKTTPATCVLVIQLLTPISDEETEDLKSVYDKIIQILESSKEEIVKCCYEIYLRKNEI
ncbi:unnamed protein product [Psylliodes chrysocephalus]|uniref:Uncharacterized protein n=1 Tax=Psylliodes chrysocephalus TaxID=3402493 RepID=A0A9P0CC49_9CUCU|nr:unnamed protein product [Psylliodes chrysocephala]